MLTVKRLTRPEQNKRNRALVLDAARRVFLARGYHGATVEHIADEAGFSRGVVYSQFGAKADLFLALLDARMAERAAQTAAQADGLAGDGGAVTLLEGAADRDSGDPAWGLLLIEFRVHAARDQELNKRYAAAHQRTVDRMAAVLGGIYQHAGQVPPLPAGHLAELVLAISSGVQLEHAANPAALPTAIRAEVLRRLLARKPRQALPAEPD
jgi:AcrR family transcriptional regulator